MAYYQFDLGRRFKLNEDRAWQILWCLKLDGPFSNEQGLAVRDLHGRLEARGALMPYSTLNKLLKDLADLENGCAVMMQRQATVTYRVELNDEIELDPQTNPFAHQDALGASPRFVRPATGAIVHNGAAPAVQPEPEPEPVAVEDVSHAQVEREFAVLAALSADLPTSTLGEKIALLMKLAGEVLVEVAVLEARAQAPAPSAENEQLAERLSVALAEANRLRDEATRANDRRRTAEETALARAAETKALRHRIRLLEANLDKFVNGKPVEDQREFRETDRMMRERPAVRG